ncbi:hypothetical protein DACRYDRAFT_25399 [Dacryopinax primogenitus]|uniref:Methyltransferase domain-containing protein n=1 Tax=Dacryopinax primogenitus (strain DJM 731) TaxID=1858805 RepID=M5FPC0_DACPD|nr:uncharacterized protein DACRYDRAFT_25399 [Dacryopinax primogenitus]EJT96958.1 hypothetical protein DACRYDRAFT_25399 [Dacryopinax primogenitus]
MRPTPDNCKLAVHDINSGLAHLNGQFDYVHTRLISSGIHDYPLMLSRINTLLRPGGLVELAEWDFRIYDADHRPVPLAPRGEPGHSWVAEWLWSLREMGVERGGHMDAATFMGEWLRSSGVWEDVGGNDTWIAISAPTGDNEEEEAYNTRMWERMKEDAKGFAAAARPAMARKMDPEKLDELISGLEREVEKGTTPRFARLQVVWARKPMVTPASSV